LSSLKTDRGHSSCGSATGASSFLIGLVTGLGRVAQTRPARIAPSPLDNATKWLLRYREFWEGSFDRNDGYLEDLQRDTGAS
jgi:hypothetical protein